MEMVLSGAVAHCIPPVQSITTPQNILLMLHEKSREPLRNKPEQHPATGTQTQESLYRFNDIT
ncbi:MAG TPA: hypothetical protein PLI62_18070 [Spirochaetota bacterium]|nr:hypothetical protein [Spirochaetota bacterium]